MPLAEIIADLEAISELHGPEKEVAKLTAVALKLIGDRLRTIEKQMNEERTC
jgi:hypothetical protein